MWYKRKAVAVALFLGIVHILVTHFSPPPLTVNEFGRAAIFIVVAYVIGYVSEQRAKGENALRESEGKLTAMLQSIGDPMSMIDKDLNIIWANENAHKIFGDDIVGKKCYAVYHNRKEPCEPYPCFVLKAFQDGKVHEYDTQVIDKDGKRLYFQRTANVALRDNEGKATAVLEISRDVTERKQAEEKQLQLLKELETANIELKDFAYIVSHDLKAPLRAITALADWLSTDYKDKLDEAGKEQLDLLMNRVRRMHNLIEGILQYSRVGRLKEEKEAVDFNALVLGVITMINPPENIGISVVNELPTVVCEKTRMEEVFQNLLSNAVRYMDKPKGEITVGCTDEDGYWKFSVADNGPGIEEKYYDKIFLIFQSLKPRDEVESTGIGLTIVKKIIETHGGKIWVNSKVGEGSTFFFTVPKERERKEIKRKEEGGSIS